MTELKSASTVAGLEKLSARRAAPGRDNVAATLAVLDGHLHDSHRGYDIGRRQTSDRFLRIEFTELAEKRAAMASELDALLTRQGIEPQVDGSTLGSMHRFVLDLQGKLFGRGRARVLREVVRGEAMLEDAYADALAEDLPAETRQLLKRHHRQVRATGDRYAAMLDEGEPEMAAPPSFLGRLNRITGALTSNPILSAVVVTAVSALTARLLRPRR
jgi:uncharacterized protein (TIGR02284 family)